MACSPPQAWAGQNVQEKISLRGRKMLGLEGRIRGFGKKHIIKTTYSFKDI